MKYLIDPSTYADPFCQELLAEGASFAAKNQVDPTSLSEEYAELEDYLDNGQSVFIGGDPGTAKTSSFRLYCHAHGLPCLVLPCSKNSRPSDFIGKTIFNPNKGVNGDMRETVFQIQGILMCFTMGIPVCVDDGTQASSDCMTTWAEFALMPDIYYCAENKTVYHRHPNFRIVITGNPGCAGHNPLPENLESRVQYIDVDFISKKGFLLLGKSKWSFLSDKFFAASYDLCLAINAYAKTNAKNHVACGIRQIQKLVVGMNNGLDIPPEDRFRRKVKHSFINLLKTKLRPDQYEAFVAAPTTTGIISKMYQEYQACPRPMSANVSVPQPAPAPQAAPAQQPQQASGNDVLGNLFKGLHV